MKDYVTRIKPTKQLLKLIKKKKVSKRKLDKITDIFYRPVGVPLAEFSPEKIIVRKRIFPRRVEICKLEIKKDIAGYATKKTMLEDLDGYEEWGRFTGKGKQYIIEIGEEEVMVLRELFSFGEYIKIEAPSVDTLKKTFELLGVNKGDRIEKNSAVLLAESEGLI